MSNWRLIKAETLNYESIQKNENDLNGIFFEKQNELKFYRIKVKNLMEKINQVNYLIWDYYWIKPFFKLVFVSSEFNFQMGEFEHIKETKHENWLTDSLIFNEEESLSLTDMTKIMDNGILLYRATRDGFTAKSFHSKCDDIPNTVTIIKNNFNYGFGG